MHVTSEFHTQPGLRRVLEALKTTMDEWKATNDQMPTHASAEHGGGEIRPRAMINDHFHGE